MLVGNKRDLKEHREVSVDEAKAFAQQHKLFFIETSALNDNNVRIAFDTLIKHIYTQTMKNSYKYTNNYGTHQNNNNNNNQRNGDLPSVSSKKSVIIDIKDDRSSLVGTPSKQEKKCCQ
eukprot:UN04006